MNNFKKLLFITSLMIMASSCSKKEEQTEVIEKQIIEVEKPSKEQSEIKVKASTYASNVILDNLVESDDRKLITDLSKNYSSIENSDFDIAIVPAYLGAYFYNKSDKNIKIAAVTQTGNIHIVSDTKLSEQADFRNKSIYVPDPAGNLAKIVDEKIGPLNFILRLNFEYYKSMDNILEKMDKINDYVTILAEPYYTKALRETHYVLNLSDILPINDKQYLSEIIIVNDQYLKNNDKAFKKFLNDYKKAIDELDNGIEISEDLLNEYDLSKKEAELALDRIDFTFITGEELKKSYNSFLDQLENLSSEVFAGERPTEDIYY